MAAKKFTAMLLTLAFAGLLASAITGEALSDCAKDCMPVCLGVEGSSIDGCGNVCETYCNSQGSDPGHGGPGIFDAELFRKARQAMAAKRD